MVWNDVLYHLKISKIIFESPRLLVPVSSKSLKLKKLLKQVRIDGSRSVSLTNNERLFFFQEYIFFSESLKKKFFQKKIIF